MFTVNKLKQETEVMINIPDSDKTPSSNVIRIEGNKEGVRKAKEVSIYMVCHSKGHQVNWHKSILHLEIIIHCEFMF